MSSEYWPDSEKPLHERAEFLSCDSLFISADSCCRRSFLHVCVIPELNDFVRLQILAAVTYLVMCSLKAFASLLTC